MNKKAQHLTEQADKLTATIDARHASAAEPARYTTDHFHDPAMMLREARRLERIQHILSKLATAHEDGTVHPLLTRVTMGIQIETMLHHTAWSEPGTAWYESDVRRFTRIGLTPENYQEARAALMLLSESQTTTKTQRQIAEARARISLEAAFDILAATGMHIEDTWGLLDGALRDIAVERGMTWNFLNEE